MAHTKPFWNTLVIFKDSPCPVSRDKHADFPFPVLPGITEKCIFCTIEDAFLCMCVWLWVAALIVQLHIWGIINMHTKSFIFSDFHSGCGQQSMWLTGDIKQGGANMHNPATLNAKFNIVRGERLNITLQQITQKTQIHAVLCPRVLYLYPCSSLLLFLLCSMISLPAP